MEDTSRDREEEEERLPEEEQPSRRKRVRYEILPEMPFYEYKESAEKDMDTILSSDYFRKNNTIDHRKKEVKNVRRYILDNVKPIPAKFNSSTSSSDVFKETKLEKDRKKRNSTIIYVRYQGSIVCTFDISRNYIGSRLTTVNEESITNLKKI